MTAALRRRHRRGSGSGRPDAEPLASETIGADRRADRGARSSAATPTRSTATSTSACARTRGTARSRTATSTTWTRARASRAPTARRTRSTSRCGRRRRRARTRPGTRPGAAGGPAGTSSARRWPRSCSASGFEIHGGGNDLVFPHHENEAAQTRAARGAELARIWMHNGMLQLGAREDGQVASATSRCCTRRSTSGAATRWSCSSLGGHYRQPLPFSTTRWTQAPAQRRGACARPGGALVAGPVAGGAGAAARALLRRAGRRLQHRRRRSRRVFEWVREANRRDAAAAATPTCARCSACSALENLLDDDGREAGAGRGRSTLARARAQAARAASDFAEADRLRDELAARGWQVRDVGRTAPRARRARGERVDPLRPQPRARGAAGAGAGRCTGLGDRGRRARAVAAPASPVEVADADEVERARGHATPTRASAPRSALPVRRRGRAARRARPADRRARRGPGPAEPRRDLPHGRVRGRDRRRHPRAALGRGHAGGVQGVGRARSSTCRSPACATSPTSWPTPRRPAAGATAPAAEARSPYDRAGLRAAASCSCSGAEGRGPAPAGRGGCDELVALPLRGRVESLNVSAAAAVAAVRRSCSVATSA